MAEKIRVIVVTRWLTRGQARSFAKNTKTFKPLFISRPKKERTNPSIYAVCRLSIGEEKFPPCFIETRDAREVYSSL